MENIVEKMVEGLLDRSNCPPSCDGHGTYCEMDSDGDPSPAPCQWCHENVMPQREQLLKALTEAHQAGRDEVVAKLIEWVNTRDHYDGTGSYIIKTDLLDTIKALQDNK